MNDKTASLLHNFTKTSNGNIVSFMTYTDYSFVLDDICSGAGPVGENGYLILWEKDVLEKRNDDYMVTVFLSNIFLIGSDGGDTAFGVTKNKQYIAVPFIGMDNDKVIILADSFDGFIERISKSDY